MAGIIRGAADLFGLGDFWGMLSHSAQLAKFSLENGKELTSITNKYLGGVDKLEGAGLLDYLKDSRRVIPKFQEGVDFDALDVDARRKIATQAARKRLSMRDLGGDISGVSKSEYKMFETAREYGLNASNARKQYFNWKSLSLGQRTARYGLFGTGVYGVGNFAYRNTFGRGRYEY